MKSLLTFLTTILIVGVAFAQTSAPVVVPAASATTAPVPPALPQSAASASSALKALEDLKAANDEFLKKQDATLQQLDELQKAARAAQDL